MPDCIIEYVWIGGKGELRSKIKIDTHTTLSNIENNLANYTWNYDGSSTGQSSGEDSEIILNPVRVFFDKTETDIRRCILLCETLHPNTNIPTKTNYRSHANNIFNRMLDACPWFGLEQEYFFVSNLNNLPLGYSVDKKQGQYYCGVGAENAFGRIIAEEHMYACLNYNIKIAGINSEVAPGQWEYQIGPCVGIQSGDHMIIAKYLLVKIAEKHNICINFEPKPLKGPWNGSGCHTNYSTMVMREGTHDKNGIEYIKEAIELLKQSHMEHMKLYGEGNKERLTGDNETASYDTFTSGVGDRGASIRIGNDTYKNKKGYLEDRRPSSNSDPYLVTSKIFETTCL